MLYAACCVPIIASRFADCVASGIEPNRAAGTAAVRRLFYVARVWIVMLSRKAPPISARARGRACSRASPDAACLGCVRGSYPRCCAA